MSGMKMRSALAWIAMIAALCVAAASVASAARMAPVGENAPEYQAYLATGGLGDLCDSETTAHTDHDCPFCRELAEPDDLMPATMAWLMDTPPEPLLRHDLVSLDQLHQHSVPARGPPCAV